MRPSTGRWRCTWAHVAPSLPPRSARSSAPARPPGAAASTGRPTALSCPGSAASATGVRSPALARRVRHVARFSPRAGVPSSFLPTPRPADVPVSQATSTWGVARLGRRRPRPRRASCRLAPPTCGVDQPTQGLAPCCAGASASASSPAGVTARREARARTVTATLGSCGSLRTGGLRSACGAIGPQSVRTPSPLQRVSAAVPRQDQPPAGLTTSLREPHAPTTRAARRPSPAVRLEDRPATRAALGAGQSTSSASAGSQRGAGKDPAQRFHTPRASAHRRHAAVHSALAVSLGAISPNSMA